MYVGLGYQFKLWTTLIAIAVQATSDQAIMKSFTYYKLTVKMSNQIYENKNKKLTAKFPE